ncbi:MAG: tRNA 2-thiouridine(34) synthase MnmA [Candidatus Pacebacteria bacterium]|nr:tRNA 2-thiouridine(34) synthase MnmA [Candidatus Paceibacterota bacterium]
MKKVIIALSGGVDSSVAAALLKKAGFEVEGIFMKLNNFSKNSEERARQVAKVLKIPIRILDLRKEFEKEIINKFLEDYKSGITPNPCVICNKEIKFGKLLKTALKEKADFIATGHYARVKNNSNLQIKPECHEYSEHSDKDSNHSNYTLLKGKDENKDQSYFLWRLDQNQLKHILFPVGGKTKGEVRKLAKKFKLPTYNTPASQEICFLPGKINDFLEKKLKAKEGNILDLKGNILAKHKGLWFYTIGQRKGIGLAGGPYYVIGKDSRKNVLFVSKSEGDLLKKEVLIKEANWISGKEPKLPLKVMTKIRYRGKETFAKIYKTKNKKYKVQFSSPQRAVTPGQSAVFYLSVRSPEGAKGGEGQVLVGGGIIC